MPRSPIVLAGVPVLAAAVALLGHQLVTRPNLLPMRDFVEYYSAGVVNLARGNPYDGGALLPIQRDAKGDPDLPEATMMWNPPWALVLVTPLGLLPAKAAHLAWLAVQLAALLASAAMLWRVYAGPPDRLMLGLVVGLFFAPFFVLMWYGQVGTLCLLGLAGFLRYRDRHPAVAGVFVALTALKPHLLFAFGLALALDALRDRRTRVAVLSGALTVAAAAGLAYLMNPDVYRHYAAAGWTDSSGSHTSPKDWQQPLVSYWFRMAVAPDTFAVQFVPTAVVAAVTAGYWFARRRTWNWPAEAPRLVFASVIAAVYGAWVFDLVVLLVPVMQATTWLLAAAASAKRTAVIAVYAVLNVVTAVGPVVLVAAAGSGVGLQAFVYFAPAVLALYAVAVRFLPRQGGSPEPRARGEAPPPWVPDTNQRPA